MRKSLFRLIVAFVCLGGNCPSLLAQDAIAPLEKKMEATLVALRKKLATPAREAFDQSGELPDECLDACRQQLDACNKILKAVGDRRKVLEKKATPANHADLRRLDVIAKQASQVVGGNNRFAVGAKWTGTMQQAQGAVQVTMTIQESDGASFAGEVSETSQFGRPVKMQVSGSFDGTNLTMKTGNMILGRACSRSYSGGVLRNRLTADVITEAPSKKGPITAPASLDLKLAN